MPFACFFLREHRSKISYIARYAPNFRVALSKKNPAQLSQVIYATGIRITSLFFMALGCMQVLRYLLNGAGDSMYALINGIVEIFARIGFSFVLTSIPAIGMWGIWLTTGLTWSVTALFALWRYKKGPWKEKAFV